MLEELTEQAKLAVEQVLDAAKLELSLIHI